jgi:hypothetical protein
MAEDLMGKVISFFSGDSNEHLSDKDLILHQRLKEIAQNKHAKLYRTKTGEVDPSLAEFLYAVYKTILPVRMFMKDTAKMIRLRQIVLEAFMDDLVTETVRRLNPALIEERIQTTPPAEIIAQIEADLAKLSAGFDSFRIAGADRCYSLVMALFQLVNFDYPSLLKKFDPNFTEGQFGGEPKFAAVRAELAVKGISEFLAVALAINPEEDWKTLLELLKLCAGQELVPPERFSQTVIGLREMCNSNILQLITQCAIKNPVWECKPRIPSEHIGEAWLETRIAEGREYINQINISQRSRQIGSLARRIFDAEDAIRLKDYTVDRAKVFRQKALGDFIYAEGLNYLRIFLEDYFERDIHELCDILLIRGQWTDIAASMEMSEAHHQLLEFSARIIAFDETLAEDGGEGSRLKAALLRIDRDHTQERYISSIIKGCNEEALEIINSAVQQLVITGKYLKSTAEDLGKKPPELIINWRELHLASKDPIMQRMTEGYKKINYLVQLLRLCTQ